MMTIEEYFYVHRPEWEFRAIPVSPCFDNRAEAMQWKEDNGDDSLVVSRGCFMLEKAPASGEAWGMAVTLDPYAKTVSMFTDEGPIVCTYQEAVDNPKISGYLLPSTVGLIRYNLEYDRQAGDR